MYRILGADEKEYGPVPADVIRRWIRERRLDARSKIRPDGQTEWSILGTLPEFAADLGGGSSKGTPVSAGNGNLTTPAAAVRPSPGPSSPAPQSTTTLGGGPRTSRLAVASFFISLTSPCTLGLSGIIGIVTGVLALRRIRRSHGGLEGRLFAKTGIVLSAFFLVAMPVLFLTIIANTSSRSRGPSSMSECTSHLRTLHEAIRRHANDNNDRFPAETNWCNAIQQGVSGVNTFQCPSRADLRCGYAINEAVAGKTKFDVPPDTVLLFECDLGWNGSGSADDAIARHNGLVLVVLANGSTRQVPRHEIGSLRWKP